MYRQDTHIHIKDAKQYDNHNCQKKNIHWLSHLKVIYNFVNGLWLNNDFSCLLIVYQLLTYNIVYKKQQ